jgi:polysaccharide deacetylase family sporulation protein PdaB
MAVKPKRKYWVILMVSMIFLCCGVLYVQAAGNLKPVYQVKTDQKVIALTFDISWGDQTPYPVLDILQEQDITATFFLSGPWVKQYPDIPRRIQADGHEVASHGYRHINYSNLSKSEVKKEISAAHDNILEITGVTANLIRMPNGDYNNQVIQAAQELGYTPVQWSVDSLDWMNPGIDNIIDRVNKKVHPGAIILMHASDTCKQTTAALPTVIQNLQEQGYQFVTVSELITLFPSEP